MLPWETWLGYWTPTFSSLPETYYFLPNPFYGEKRNYPKMHYKFSTLKKNISTIIQWNWASPAEAPAVLFHGAVYTGSCAGSMALPGSPLSLPAPAEIISSTLHLLPSWRTRQIIQLDAKIKKRVAIIACACNSSTQKVAEGDGQGYIVRLYLRKQ